MTSFLATCPQCGIMGPKEGRCPNCGHSDSAIEDIAATTEISQDFTARYAIHARNKAVEMMIMLALGFSGLITAFLWLLVIYRANITAFLFVGVFTVLTGILTAVRFFSDRWFPTKLLCPSCSARLDTLRDIGEECPACNTILRVEMPELNEVAAEAETAATS